MIFSWRQSLPVSGGNVSNWSGEKSRTNAWPSWILDEGRGLGDRLSAQKPLALFLQNFGLLINFKSGKATHYGSSLETNAKSLERRWPGHKERR